MLHYRTLVLELTSLLGYLYDCRTGGIWKIYSFEELSAHLCAQGFRTRGALKRLSKNSHYNDFLRLRSGDRSSTLTLSDPSILYSTSYHATRVTEILLLRITKGKDRQRGMSVQNFASCVLASLPSAKSKRTSLPLYLGAQPPIIPSPSRNATQPRRSRYLFALVRDGNRHSHSCVNLWIHWVPAPAAPIMRMHRVVGYWQHWEMILQTCGRMTSYSGP